MPVIWMVDSHLCAVQSRLAAAARLMGAHSIMCGMNAQVAITLQTMGIDMDVVRTALTLEEAFKSLGIGRLEKKRDGRGGADSKRGGHAGDGTSVRVGGDARRFVEDRERARN
jgi:hypothetical protein